MVLVGLTLPVVIIHIAALVFPIPRLLASDGGLGQYLLGVAMVLGFWYLLGGLLVAGWSVDGVRRVLDRVLLALPLVGKCILRLELSRYSRCFASLHAAGVPAMECASTATSVCANKKVSELVSGGAESVARGSPVSEGFAPGLPAEFVALWATGEESGRLEEMATRLADRMAEDAEFLMAELARWIPRVIYAVIVIQMALMILNAWGALLG